jgi:hypothetical protein
MILQVRYWWLMMELRGLSYLINAEPDWNGDVTSILVNGGSLKGLPFMIIALQ